MKFSFNLLSVLFLFGLSYALPQKQFLSNIERIKQRQLEEEKVYWPCSTKGIVQDENNNPIPKVKISGKLSIMNADLSLTFYKELPATETDESGNFVLKYEIEDNSNIVTLEENLKFEYTQFGEKQLESRAIVINRPNYFGSKDFQVIMKFKGLIEGAIKDSTGTTTFQEAEVKAQVKETGKTAATSTNNKGEFKLKIEVPPNKKTKVIMTVKPKNQEKYKEQEFIIELGPDNDYQQVSEKLVMLKEKEIEVKGEVQDMKGKPAKKAYVKIKIGEQIIETETDNEGKFDKVFELSKDNYKQDKDIKSEILSKSGDQFNSQEFTIKKEEKVYLIKPIKLTNKLNYQITIKKLINTSQKEIRENDIKIKALIGGFSFVLERKTIKGETEKSKYIYFYEGNLGIERKGTQLEGKIVISGGQYYADQEVSIKENIEKLEALSLTTEIKEIILQEQKKALELKGLVLGSAKNEKLIDAQISVSITCQSCKKKATVTSTAKTDKNGQFILKIRDAIELNQEQTIQLIVSSSGYLEKTVSKQFNGKIEELEKLKTEEWKIVLESKSFLVIEGIVKDKLSSQVLPKSKISATILSQKYETTTDEQGKFQIKQELKKEQLVISVDLTIIPESNEYSQYTEKIQIKQESNYKLVKTFELLKKNALIFRGIVKQYEDDKSIKLANDASIEITIYNEKQQKQKLIGKSDANGKYQIGGILDSQLLSTINSVKAIIKIEKGDYFNIKEVQLKAGQQEYEMDIVISNEITFIVKVGKITNSEGQEIKDDKINLQIKLTSEKNPKDIKEFSLKTIKAKENIEYEGSIALKIANEKMTGNLVISGISDYKEKTIPLTVDLKNKDKIQIINEIKVIILEEKSIKKLIVFEGVVKRDEDKTVVNGVKIIVERECKSLKQAIQTVEKLTDENGKFQINEENIIVGEKYLFKFTVSKQDMVTKTLEETIELKESDPKIVKKEINFALQQQEKLFQLEVKGQIKDNNGKGVANTNIEIEVLNADNTGKQTLVNKQEGKTDKDGKYDIKVNIKETIQGDVIIKVTPKDKWVEGKSTETKIILDLEKQKNKEQQIIEVEAIQVKLKECQSFTLSGKVTGDVTGKELEKNMKGIQNAQIELKLKDNSSGKEKTIKVQTIEDGSYKIEIKQWIYEGIEYTTELKVSAPHFQEAKDEFIFKTIEDTTVQVKDVRLKTNLVIKAFELKGEVKDQEKNPSQEADVVLMEKRGDKWVEIAKGKTNDKGQFEVKGEITGDKDSVIEAKLQIKGDKLQTKEEKITIDLNQKGTIVLDAKSILVEKKKGILKVSGQVFDNSNNKPLADVKVIGVINNNGKQIYQSQTISNKNGEFEINSNNDLEIGVEYEVLITTEKANYVQVNEIKQSKVIKLEIEQLQELKIQMKPTIQTVTIEVQGVAYGTEADEKLYNADILVEGTYSDQDDQIQAIKLEGKTNNIGEFDLKKSLSIKKSTVISCQIRVTKEHYIKKELTFKLNEENNYKKIFESKIELNYDFLKPDGYETVIGIIQRKEQCGEQLINHPVPDFLLKFYLSDYYTRPLLYTTLKTNKDGTFEIKAPIFSYINYNANIYYPYQSIEGNDKDAYVSSSTSFDIYYKDKGKQINMGTIQISNRRDSPFECSSQTK